jgi:hypothetical protein
VTLLAEMAQCQAEVDALEAGAEEQAPPVRRGHPPDPVAFLARVQQDFGSGQPQGDAKPSLPPAPRP